jgi:lysozyme family protein
VTSSGKKRRVKKMPQTNDFPYSFLADLKFVLKWEGGLTDDPDDPGGRTNRGITQREYDRFRKSKGLPTQDVAEISDDEVNEIYYRNYWKAVRCDELPVPLRLVVFDTAVNMGVMTSVKLLQQALNEFLIQDRKLKVDGILGPKTLEAALSMNAQAVAKKMLEFRLYRYCDIVKGNPKLVKFLKGWVSRVLALWRQFA